MEVLEVKGALIFPKLPNGIDDFLRLHFLLSIILSFLQWLKIAILRFLKKKIKIFIEPTTKQGFVDKGYRSLYKFRFDHLVPLTGVF